MKTYLTRSAFLAAAIMLSAAGAQAAGPVTAKNGMTLYVFDKDTGGTPSCYDDCAQKWPPYVGKADEKMAKDWTMIKRKDDTMQWAYDGKPVYFYASDKKKGDKTGDGVGGVWHLIME